MVRCDLLNFGVNSFYFTFNIFITLTKVLISVQKPLKRGTVTQVLISTYKTTDIGESDARGADTEKFSHIKYSPLKKCVTNGR
jgi:hypothetical protein